MSNDENFDYYKIKDKYSETKACADGIFYYYNKIAVRIMANPESEYADTLAKFGSVLTDFRQTENQTAVMDMDSIFDEFYPNGQLAAEFISHDLRYAFDGISEYLMRLKKMLMI